MNVPLAPGAVGLGVTTQPKPVELKCATVAAIALTRLLAGRFGNLAVYDLYQDATVREARHAVLRLALAGSPDTVASYPKTESAVVLLAHTIADNSALDLVQLPAPLFARLVSVLAAACGRSASILSTPAAFTIEALAVLKCRAVLYVDVEAKMRSEGSVVGAFESVALRPDGFRPSALSALGRARGRIVAVADMKAAAARFREHDDSQPNLFGDVLDVLVDRIITSADYDLPNLYAIARPIVPLCVCAPGALRRFVAKFVAAQSPSRQELVAESFEPLFKLLQDFPDGRSHAAELLRQHEEVTKELCRFARKWRDSFAAHLREQA